MDTKTLICSLIALVTAGTQATAQLRFTSGTVSNLSGVTLTLHGPTNVMCQVERLSRTNQTWQSVGTVRLDAAGNAALSTYLDEGAYGFFRAKSTNGVYRSTNAFGAVVGWLSEGYSMVGNPFDTTTLATFLPEPVEGTGAFKCWQGNYESADFVLGEWTVDMSLGMCEGMIVYTPSNNVQPFVCSGLFGTNTTAKSLPVGLSILCSQRYPLITPTNWVADVLSTNRLGGYSGLPVTLAGTNNQCTIHRMVDPSGGYQIFTLTSTNQWVCNGLPTQVPLELAEGFWFSKDSTSTWFISRPIW